MAASHTKPVTRAAAPERAAATEERRLRVWQACRRDCGAAVVVAAAAYDDDSLANGKSSVPSLKFLLVARPPFPSSVEYIGSRGQHAGPSLDDAGDGTTRRRRRRPGAWLGGCRRRDGATAATAAARRRLRPAPLQVLLPPGVAVLSARAGGYPTRTGSCIGVQVGGAARAVLATPIHHCSRPGLVIHTIGASGGAGGRTLLISRRSAAIARMWRRKSPAAPRLSRATPGGRTAGAYERVRAFLAGRWTSCAAERLGALRSVFAANLAAAQPAEAKGSTHSAACPPRPPSPAPASPVLKAAAAAAAADKGGAKSHRRQGKPAKRRRQHDPRVAVVADDEETRSRRRRRHRADARCRSPRRARGYASAHTPSRDRACGRRRSGGARGGAAALDLHGRHPRALGAAPGQPRPHLPTSPLGARWVPWVTSRQSRRGRRRPRGRRAAGATAARRLSVSTAAGRGPPPRLLADGPRRSGARRRSGVRKWTGKIPRQNGGVGARWRSARRPTRTSRLRREAPVPPLVDFDTRNCGRAGDAVSAFTRSDAGGAGEEARKTEIDDFAAAARAAPRPVTARPRSRRPAPAAALAVPPPAAAFVPDPAAARAALYRRRRRAAAQRTYRADGSLGRRRRRHTAAVELWAPHDERNAGRRCSALAGVRLAGELRPFPHEARRSVCRQRAAANAAAPPRDCRRRRRRGAVAAAAAGQRRKWSARRRRGPLRRRRRPPPVGT